MNKVIPFKISIKILLALPPSHLLDDPFPLSERLAISALILE
jgi:hypothetical protein